MPRRSFFFIKNREKKIQSFISSRLLLPLVYMPIFFFPALQIYLTEYSVVLVHTGQEEGTLTITAAGVPFSSAKVLQIALLSSFLTWALSIYMRNSLVSF